MPHAFPRWWFLLLVAMLALAAFALGDAFGIVGAEPGRMPVGYGPPSC